MSMTAHYKHVPTALLSLLCERQELVEPFLVALPLSRDPGLSDAVAALLSQQLAEMKEEERRYLEELAAELDQDSARLLLQEAQSPGMTLDKQYQQVQFHVSGETGNPGACAAARAVTGAGAIGRDLGYGPAGLLAPDEVAACQAALSAISEQDFLRRYPSSDWDSEETEGSLLYFIALREYYAEAARLGRAMLVWGA